MKQWKSPEGVVYHRLAKGIVFMRADGRARFYRMAQSIGLETSADLTCWFRVDLVDSHPLARVVREAIAALWPKPTKGQLWREVTRLAGEVAFRADPSLGAYQVLGGGASAIRQLIAVVRASDSPQLAWRPTSPKLLAKLEKALAAWEAAK